MPCAFFFGLFCLTATGFVAVGVATYLLGVSRPKIRFTASVAVLLIAAIVAFTPLLLIAVNPEARAALQDKAREHALGQEHATDTPSLTVLRWMALYGEDTAQAATLTTLYFRNGDKASVWARKTQAVLETIKYEHLGGEIVNETITGETAVVTVKARISAAHGVSTQTEVYTLRRIKGQWFIDELEVKNEVLEALPK
ncbi:MAG: hypothetical protein AB7P69_16230 [Candidatus Binatia bacterium]